ncbi:hypothetical protein C2G38_1347007 [Gigaspora rosea]|uniref:Serine-threonine/tyrosine-protein kinase catalytic domain-containing protein n=1 Tax=Gigaspora rosea TaxID=44941 RepID=A0A397VF07_9GLOM|nr:hypothetical protein C2G38_1347007 [Gigaspora rosea]
MTCRDSVCRDFDPLPIIWEVISGRRQFSDCKHDEYLILDILDGILPKIPTNTPKELVELIERCWYQDIEIELVTLLGKANNGEIKFTDNKGTNISPTEINDQAFYSSRPLTLLISKALTLQSMRLNSNVITGKRIYCMAYFRDVNGVRYSRAVFEISVLRVLMRTLF